MLSATLTSVLDLATSRAAEQQYHMLPGVVVSYDPITRSADIQVAVKVFTKDEFGDPFHQEVPVLASVPVALPRGGGFIWDIPLQPGDSGIVLFSTLDSSAWELSGRAPAEPLNVDRHGMSSCVFFPGWFPDVTPPAPADNTARATDLIIGKDGGAHIRQDGTTGVFSIGGTSVAPATDDVALANKLDTFLTALYAAIHTGLAACTGGAAGAAAFDAAVALTPFVTAQAAVHATKVKAK